GNEFGEGFLFKRGGLAVAEPLGGQEGADQALRRDQVADAESGKDGARESPDVNDAALLIEPLQRLERLAVIAEFSVIVILDDDGVLAFGPVQKGNAPGQRKYGAGRKLMRRRDERQTGIRRQPGGIYSVVVHGDGNQAGAGCPKGFGGSLIARILEGHA